MTDPVYKRVAQDALLRTEHAGIVVVVTFTDRGALYVTHAAVNKLLDEVGQRMASVCLDTLSEQSERWTRG